MLHLVQHSLHSEGITAYQRRQASKVVMPFVIVLGINPGHHKAPFMKAEAFFFSSALFIKTDTKRQKIFSQKLAPN